MFSLQKVVLSLEQSPALSFSGKQLLALAIVQHADIRPSGHISSTMSYLNDPLSAYTRAMTYLLEQVMIGDSRKRVKWKIFPSTKSLNPLTLKIDQHLISQCKITPESNIKVMRKKGNYHQMKKFLIVRQILLVSALKNVWRTVWRIFIPIFLWIGCHSVTSEISLTTR